MVTAREGVHALGAAAPKEARLQGRAAAKAEVRRAWPRIIIAVAFVNILIVLFGGWALTNLYLRQAATDSAVTSLRQQAEQSKVTGDQANRELQARGQPPVPIPAPGTAPDTDVIAQAAAARVLASLPDSSPSAVSLGQAVARYVAANPIAPAQPTPGQISSVLAGYFATSPPPSGAAGQPGTDGSNGAAGPAGPAGQAGPPPTAEAIEAAVGQYFTDHPEALCPRGGSIAQIRVQLADGGSADTYTCVVATYPSPSTGPIIPIPPT